jgi:hypothetical protein
VLSVKSTFFVSVVVVGTGDENAGVSEVGAGDEVGIDPLVVV